MQSNNMKIKVLVFKTSINSNDIGFIKMLLDDMVTTDEKWNVDLEDRDNILRVESILLKPADVIKNLQLAGFACEELED